MNEEQLEQQFEQNVIALIMQEKAYELRDEYREYQLSTAKAENELELAKRNEEYAKSKLDAVLHWLNKNSDAYEDWFAELRIER